MDIFAPNAHYSSQYSRGEYARAKKEKEEAQTYLDKYAKKLSGQITSLKENVAKYHKGEFTGWAVTHRFRCPVPEEMIFFCDEEFATCVGYDIEEIEDFMEILTVVDEATSDEDIMDYFEESSFLF